MPNGYVLWKGKSLIDRVTPVVCVMTMHSANIKTDDMIQTWILLQDTPPHEAVKQNEDEPICGTCIHRLKRSCYVEVWQAPNKVWKQWKAGKYPPLPKKHALLAGRSVRIGAYGDPAAVPLGVWDMVAALAEGVTGYTHCWADRPDLARYCMASVETRSERQAAKALGFRTYRAHPPTDQRIVGEEARCPAGHDAPTKITCLACGYCNGNHTGFTGDVAIPLHGNRAGRLLQGDIPLEVM